MSVFCEHGWPGSGCRDCAREVEQRERLRAEGICVCTRWHPPLVTTCPECGGMTPAHPDVPESPAVPQPGLLSRKPPTPDAITLARARLLEYQQALVRLERELRLIDSRRESLRVDLEKLRESAAMISSSGLDAAPALSEIENRRESRESLLEKRERLVRRVQLLGRMTHESALGVQRLAVLGRLESQVHEIEDVDLAPESKNLNHN